MRSFRGLFATIVDPENLWCAWLDARRGKRRTAMAASFELDAERQLLKLRRELVARTYRPQRYRLLRVSDPKRRLIAAAPFRDRVVHHALVRVAHPCYGRSFIDYSYACLTGRGSHRAVLAFLHRTRTNRYVLTLDIVRYFPSVSWVKLREILARRTPGQEFLDLVDTILRSAAGLYQNAAASRFLGWSPMPGYGYGLPIGNYTSQWFGNLYLDGLDHFVKRRLKVRAYQRYMDDMVLFADSKRQIHAWKDEITRWLADERGLQVHTERAHPHPCRGSHKYLGYIVTPAGIRPGPRIERRMRDRLPLHLHGNPGRLARSLASYRGAYLL